MTIISIPNNPKLSNAIKKRREDLGFTITSAAMKAGINPKSWSRYEAGESIREDKANLILKTLKWSSFPDGEDDYSVTFNIEHYKKHPLWSPYLENNFNQYIAAAFIIGSEILSDELQDDIDNISKKPKGTHLGELEISWMDIYLPEIYLTKYDYEFLYKMKLALKALTKRVAATEGTGDLKAHTVMEEILLLTIAKEAEILMEEWEKEMDKAGLSYKSEFSFQYDSGDEDEAEYVYKGYHHRWVFEIFDDMDVIDALYSDDGSVDLLDDDALKTILGVGDYGFDNWFKKQFYC